MTSWRWLGSTPAGPPSRRPTHPGRASAVDPADLRALQAKPRHQTLLVEDERVDIALRRAGGEGLRLARVHDDDARSHADLETFALLQVVESGVGHEEQHVAEGLDASLETVGGGHGVVVADVLALLAKDALPVLGPEEEAGLHDAREDKHGHRLPAQVPSLRDLLVELGQG